MLLEPGLNLTLRPLRYPGFYEMYKNAIKNTWTVEEVDFSQDLVDLRTRLTPAEGHLVSRLVAFFATGDSIVANNLVLNLYTHLNAPEARLFLSRQLFEEAVHVDFYLALLDAYVPDPDERAQAFAAVDHVPSIARKAEFSQRWMDSLSALQVLRTRDERRRFVLNLACFAGCNEGLFFFAAFAYVYYLRSRGLLPGLATGTNWVFRDESGHIGFAFATLEIIRREEPELFDDAFDAEVTAMMREAVDAESAFAADVLAGGVAGLSHRDMRAYLESVADQRLVALGARPVFGARNPFGFMAFQDVQELANFFERRVSAYQVAVPGRVSFDEEF